MSAHHPERPEKFDDDRTVAAPANSERIVDHRDLVARQKEQFGGMKFGSAFFGWLTATGLTVLLVAALTAAGTAVGVGTNTSLDEAADIATQDANTTQTVGLAGGIAVLVVLLIAYYCGGYVAGRMARFNGIRQGLAVWIWTIVISIVVAVVAAVAGSQYDILGNLDAFPRIPVDGDIGTAGAIALGAAALASLVGALLGGLAGMRFHRKVDKAALDPRT
ncbi:MAG: hypothetical protein U5N21_14735 [Rhodococcus sp. (in: high G+C Gram-positive bacteria)]|nr:hypothetical protein [Rhodococcus sp. (in: high G+C Gram-positive bacteria)]